MQKASQPGSANARRRRVQLITAAHQRPTVDDLRPWFSPKVPGTMKRQT
jgi:hypothetical protein